MPAGTQYRETPPARLAAYVECFWKHGPSSLPVRVLPDTCVDVVFSDQVGLQLLASMSRAMLVEAPRHSFVGVRLRAGTARSLLGSPVQEMRDHVVPACDVLGKCGVALERCLRSAESEDERIRMLETALVPAHRVSSLQKAIGYLAANGGCVRLDDIARHTGLGLSPPLRRRDRLISKGTGAHRTFSTSVSAYRAEPSRALGRFCL